MKNKLNAAVIGLGVGAKHAQILNSDKSINLVTLCDLDIKKINFYKKKYKNCKFTTDSNKIFKDPNIKKLFFHQI